MTTVTESKPASRVKSGLRPKKRTPGSGRSRGRDEEPEAAISMLVFGPGGACTSMRNRVWPGAMSTLSSARRSREPSDWARCNVRSIRSTAANPAASFPVAGGRHSSRTARLPVPPAGGRTRSPSQARRSGTSRAAKKQAAIPRGRAGQRGGRAITSGRAPRAPACAAARRRWRDRSAAHPPRSSAPGRTRPGPRGPAPPRS